MYHSYFGLDEQAFSIAVNPRYLYMSTQHKEALAHLLYGVSSGGFVMLTGEVGTGKTTIIRCLLGQLPSAADIAVVMNPSANERDLLCSICDEFGVSYVPNETSLKILTDKLTEFLVDNHKREHQSIVLIDEAQLLKVSTLEQIRLLTNLETNTQKLLQIILVGQPELNELLAKPELRQLSQRITARYHLRALTESETEAYVTHRLKIAGLSSGRHPFPPNIISKIHSVSRGIPRLVNIFCDRMLLGAYSRGLTLVDGAICRKATLEVLGEGSGGRPRKSYTPELYVGFGLGVGALAILLLWILVWAFSDSEEPQEVLQAKTDVVVEPSGVLESYRSLKPSVKEPLKTTETTQPSSTDEYWVHIQDLGVKALLDSLGLLYRRGAYSCWAIAKKGYHCETDQALSWQEFRKINRPAVLTIITPDKNEAYVTLVGLKGQDAWLKVGSKLQRVALNELSLMWTGEFTFVWQRPEFYKEALGLGSRGDMVAWIAQQFAILDQQTNPITNSVFTQALKKRVMFFQKKHNLVDDGIVGFHTLLKLNEELGVDKSLPDLESTLMGVE